ncbi:hypothetical protein F9874_11245 [Glaesserella parasuis]|uniref:hypothetical protein n=1 Tax=Glaesserella parasuis TaxID=738 RepID=UPI00132444C0|nr:hypothetical protein [Glaesserella parasuis]MWQ00728.1 hypothetical protein [Glaesserella parasuis]MWQ46108.1 hypothetical protein [Glaesserella parasuis]MWQ62645.1 hypothetical protein [Glaesserella parasuis]
MTNKEFAKQEWDKAANAVSYLKSSHSKLDFKQHCIDLLDGKNSVDYFILLITWTWNNHLVELNGLSGLTHWAIWTCCEDYPLSDDDEYPVYPANVGEFKETVQLALDDNYYAIWERLGLSDQEIKDLSQ